jgi:hypothetical protein
MQSERAAKAPDGTMYNEFEYRLDSDDINSTKMTKEDDYV